MTGKAMDFRAHRISSLFITVPGLLLAGLFLFLGLLYRQTDLSVLCFLLFGIIGVLRLWGSFSLFRIDCPMEAREYRVFPGEAFTFGLELVNRKVLPVWVRMSLPVEGLSHARSTEGFVAAERSLLWYQRTRLEWGLTAIKRGVYAVGPIHVRSGDLFGFFPREKDMSEAVAVIVYPRLVPVKPPLPARRDFFGMAGKDGPVKDPVYILGTTDYHQARPARYIHWKASARHDRIQEKVFEPSEQEKVLIIIDVEGFPGERGEESFEETLETVASLAVHMDRRGKAVGLLTNGTLNGGGPSFLRVTRSGAHLSRILESCARLTARPTTGVAEILTRGISLSFGISCIYFAYEEGRPEKTARAVLQRQRIPAMLITYASLPRIRAGSRDYLEGDGDRPSGAYREARPL